MTSENTKNSRTDNKFNELRDIRKEKGLTIQDVARQLKLSSDTIEKIESNKLNELGAYTYIRGYVFNYANLLGVNPDKYIAVIPKSKMDVPLINTAASNSKSITFRRKSKSMVGYVLGTFIVLTVSFSGWYLLKSYTSSAKNKGIDIVDKTNLEIIPQKTLPLNFNYTVKPNKDMENTEGSYHYSSLIPSVQNKQENNSLEIPQKNEPQEITFEEQSQKKPEMDSSYLITVIADETSWVKVEYLKGKEKLHNDLLKPGTVSFKSFKPVHFRIGNSKKVKVTINGENIDLSEYSKKNIADFNWPLDS